jgi:tRNA (guanine37-N1)-methyltransferase
VLLSGDHAAIRRWRLQQALGRTWERRPDLLERRAGTDADEERALLAEDAAGRAGRAGLRRDERAGGPRDAGRMR